jgi:RimJ/RimL family protein N-acetyltransferase
MELDLLAVDRSLAAALAAGDRTAIRDAPNLAEAVSLVEDVARAQLDLFDRTGAGAPWIAYLARERGTGRLLGICAFKDAPRAGEVEIAYYTFPEVEGAGVGGAMAGALIGIAQASPAVERIVAHTSPEENASVRILRRHGFVRLGPVEDPEDGPVWRFEKRTGRDETRRS